MSRILMPEFTKAGINAIYVTENQKYYLETIRSHAVTLCAAPPGTGKTHIAVAEAFRSIVSQGDKRIRSEDKHIYGVIFIRPAKSADEDIGHLPGDLDEKISHYMKPFYPIIRKVISPAHLHRLRREEAISFETLSFLRGQTWENKFVLIDEAQNTTVAQMKMCLSRIGKRSRLVIVGDEFQSDLGPYNGFTDALDRFDNEDSVGICELGEEDNMRHPIVRILMRAYDR